MQEGQFVHVNGVGYEVGEYIDEGRYAKVYAARAGGSTADGNRVAIKIMHSGQDWRQEFEKERQILLGLRAVPWVICLKTWGHYDGRPFLVLELLDVRYDLEHRTTPFDLHEGLAFCLQFYQMLRLAHSKRILYNDLKKEHLFWDGRLLKIIDWNVSKLNCPPHEFSKDLKDFAEVVGPPVPGIIQDVLTAWQNSNAHHMLFHLLAVAHEAGLTKVERIPSIDQLALLQSQVAFGRQQFALALLWAERGLDYSPGNAQLRSLAVRARWQQDC